MLKKEWKIRERIRANRKSERGTAHRTRADASASPEPDNKAKRREWGAQRPGTWMGNGLLRLIAHEKKEESVSERRQTGGTTTTPWTVQPAHYTRTRMVPSSTSGPSDRGGVAGWLAEKPNEPTVKPPMRSARSSTAAEMAREPDGEPPRRSPPREQETRGRGRT